MTGRSGPTPGAAGAMRFFSEEGARFRATAPAAAPRSFSAMIAEHEGRMAADPAGEAARTPPAGEPGVGADGKRGVFGAPDRKGDPDGAANRLLTEDTTTWVNSDDVTQGVLGRPSDEDRRKNGGMA